MIRRQLFWLVVVVNILTARSKQPSVAILVLWNGLQRDLNTPDFDYDLFTFYRGNPSILYAFKVIASINENVEHRRKARPSELGCLPMIYSHYVLSSLHRGAAMQVFLLETYLERFSKLSLGMDDFQIRPENLSRQQRLMPLYMRLLFIGIFCSFYYF